MKTILLLTSLALTSAFTPHPSTNKPVKHLTTKLHSDRRDFCFAAGLGLLGTMPAAANAKAASTWFFDEKIEQVFEPSQQATDGRLDLNNAFVGEYTSLPGMFPHAAGKIASHGPYKTVADIYKIPNLTDHDRQMFKKYEHLFAVNPPGRRTFDERLNARVST